MSTTQQEVKNLKQDITKLKNELANQIEDKASEAKDTATLSKENLKIVANEAGKTVRGFIDEKQDQIETAKDTCERTIKNRPLTSAAVAFVGGVLLTSLLKRK